MIKVEISSKKPERKQGVAKTGRPYDFFVQEAYAFLVERDGSLQPYPSRFRVRVSGNDVPYVPGEYTLHPSGFYVKEEDLTFSTSLVPVKART